MINDIRLMNNSDNKYEGFPIKIDQIITKLYEINPTNMPLHNPNPFFKKMKQRDPELFLVKKDGKFNAYSKVCASNLNKQPVILTDAELAKIDKEHPG